MVILDDIADFDVIVLCIRRLKGMGLQDCVAIIWQIQKVFILLHSVIRQLGKAAFLMGWI